MNSQPARAPFELPRLTLQAREQYVIGFPLILAVTLTNDSKENEYYGLPEVDVIYDHGPLGVSVVGTSADHRHEIRPTVAEEGRSGMALAPGEQKSMLLDLSNFGFALVPDSYAVAVSVRIGKYDVQSAPVRIALVRPSPTDSAEAVRLRALGHPSAVDHGAWGPFLTKNWTTVVARPGLEPSAREQLSLHLFLHYALYGPRAVGALDPDVFASIQHESLAAEVAALSFEISATRLDQARRKALFDADVERWPGIRFRLERALDQEGWLTTYRTAFGAEADLSRPGPAPYRDRDQ